MKVRPILNLLGIGLVFFSFFQLLPIAISLVYHENYFTGYIGVFKGNSSTAIQWDGANNLNNSSILIREGKFEDVGSDYKCHAHYFSFLDTAGTTSAITYNIKGYTNNNGYPTYINRAMSRDSGNANFPLLRSTLTLTEHSA